MRHQIGQRHEMHTAIQRGQPGKATIHFIAVISAAFNRRSDAGGAKIPHKHHLRAGLAQL